MAGGSADVAGVEVAVDQRVRYAARLEVCESLWQSFDEGIQSAPALLVQLVAVAIDHRVDPRQGGLRSLVEEPESFELGDAAGPGSLEVDEHARHHVQLLAAGLVLVLARNVGQQHAMRSRTQDGRHDVLVEQRHDGGLGGTERRGDLQPHRTSAGREPPDA